MAWRFYLLIHFVVNAFLSNSQILEEMTAEQFGSHMDSLIARGEIVKAYDQFYEYGSFLPTYNLRQRENKSLLEISKRVQNAQISSLSEKSDEQLFELYRPYLSQIIKTKNYQKAILILNHFNKINEAKVLLDSVTMILPFDIVNVYQHHFPVQLFSVPQRELYDSNYDRITDDFTIYRKSDSSLFTGVIISRTNSTESMMNDLANLAYDKYVNGQRIERKAMSFRRSLHFPQDLYRNDLFFGYDSSHYGLYHMVIANRTDTIRSFFYSGKDHPIKEETSVKTTNKGIQSIFIAEYNLDGSIKSWKEKAPYSAKHEIHDDYWCWVNQFGDTINEGFVDNKDGSEIYQERTLNSKGDTLILSRTVNSFMDGLQIENRKSGDEFNFELRYVFKDGKLTDVLSDSVLYFDELGKIITEEAYIQLMNSEGNRYSYFYSGFFKEYFPEVEFKTHSYFLSVSDIHRKNFKRFKKSVKKYFKVKI